MCLVLFAYQMHPAYPLVVLANRDEYYDRPTEACAPWQEAPELYAGRDLQSGGTWFGVCRDGRFGVVTNVREADRSRGHERSRGWLVRDYLLGDTAASAFADQHADCHGYAGFNLLLGDSRQLWYVSNRTGSPRLLPPGIYGLSNHLLDTPWPKVVRGKAAFTALLEASRIDPDSAFALMADAQAAPDESLPSTGVPQEWERALSAIFIKTPTYGTRCSTLYLVDIAGHALLMERSFQETGVFRDVCYEID